MDRDALLTVLAAFFMDTFREDPIATGDWVAQGGQDIDEIVELVKEIVGE